MLDRRAGGSIFSEACDTFAKHSGSWIRTECSITIMFDFEGSRGEFLKLLAEMGEEPAFVSRGLAPQAALDTLLKTCAVHREEQLHWPRRHFATLRRRVAGDWSRLQRFLTDAREVDSFAKLERQLDPCSDSNAFHLFTSDRRELRRLVESAGRFNKTWTAFVSGEGLDHVNELRENYNQFYPMEKACAFGNDRVNEGFRPLPKLDASVLLDRFPLLMLPALR